MTGAVFPLPAPAALLVLWPVRPCAWHGRGRVPVSCLSMGRDRRELWEMWELLECVLVSWVHFILCWRI